MKPGIYEHYKGGRYLVIGPAFHTETEEKMILYQALYPCPDLEAQFGLQPYFVRPAAMFSEEVQFEGNLVPRFKFIASQAK